MNYDAKDKVIRFLAVVAFFMMSGCILLVLIFASQQDEINSITAACATEGQFTVSGRTYRCAAITQETLNESYKRQFEHCRTWLHNPWRGRDLP